MNACARIPSPPLELLVGDLSRQAKRLADYFQSNGLPEPSFQRDAPIDVLSPEAPKEIQAVRDQLMDHALQIFQLVAGPREYLENVQTNYQYMEALRWLSYFHIFELVPLEGNISYAELAGKAAVSELRLKSIARMAMTNHLFVEPVPGFLAHSATSAALTVDQQLVDQREWQGRVLAPTIASMVTAHKKWPDSTALNRTAFSVAFDTELAMYEYISKQPDLHTLFGRLMEGVAASPKSSLKHLVDGFAWRDLGKATVVDIGGNIGHSCVALAKAFPQLEFIVQDSAHVVKQGEIAIQQNNEAVSKRIRFQEYDFFQEQPVTSADVYLFRQILHNWDFSHSVQILKSTVKSMSEGSHMLIMDFDLPEPGSVPSVNERVVRSRDVVMMQLFNSFERDLSDWKLLFAAVDPRLKINAVNTPFGSFCSVIDLILEG